MNNISFKQYRTIDLVIWTVILCVFEAITVLGSVKWFPDSLFTLSQTLMVTCVVMMRWGAFGVAYASVGGLVLAVLTGANVGQYFIYIVGNLGTVAGYIFLKKLGSGNVRAKLSLSLLYVFVSFIGMQAGRWLVALFFGGRADSIIVFYTTDSLTLLYAAVVIFIARRVDGLFENQREYLIRTEAERTAEQME